MCGLQEFLDNFHGSAIYGFITQGLLLRKQEVHADLTAPFRSAGKTMREVLSADGQDQRFMV